MSLERSAYTQIKEAFKRLEIKPFKVGDTVKCYYSSFRWAGDKSEAEEVLVHAIQIDNSSSGVTVSVLLPGDEKLSDLDLWYFSTSLNVCFGNSPEYEQGMAAYREKYRANKNSSSDEAAAKTIQQLRMEFDYENLE